MQKINLVFGPDIEAREWALNIFNTHPETSLSLDADRVQVTMFTQKEELQPLLRRVVDEMTTHLRSLTIEKQRETVQTAYATIPSVKHPIPRGIKGVSQELREELHAFLRSARITHATLSEKTGVNRGQFSAAIQEKRPLSLERWYKVYQFLLGINPDTLRTNALKSDWEELLNRFKEVFPPPK